MRFDFLASAVLLGILGGVIPAAAQDPEAQNPDPQAPLSGAANGGFRDTVVVTASLEEVESREVPASVTVFDREDIEARQAVTVLELLATAPGFSVTRSGSPGHATSAFARGTESDQTLALWNGIPLNDPFFGAFDWAYLSADGAERVEVVRGPLSTLYGSAALGGAVNVISGRQRGAKLRLESGEDGYGRGSLTAGAEAVPVTTTWWRATAPATARRRTISTTVRTPWRGPSGASPTVPSWASWAG